MIYKRKTVDISKALDAFCKTCYFGKTCISRNKCDAYDMFHELITKTKGEKRDENWFTEYR